MKERKPGERIPIPASVREYVFQRDGFRCRSCGKSPPEVQLQVDHIVPLAQGGSNDISNLQTLCKVCNQRKKDRWDPRFRRHFDL
ncbi:HNH endonuclease [Synechococcus sp. H65.1]|uniref:HNH endonuclease n=1 Tax=unclassified Synechococcus TaxID=2626047 RepID=UPI0039C33C46